MSYFLDDLCNLIKRHQIDEPTANKIRTEIIKMFGGETVYIRKQTTEKVKDCHVEIKRCFTGNNHRQLARKFDIGMTQIYRIVKHPTTTA